MTGKLRQQIDNSLIACLVIGIIDYLLTLGNRKQSDGMHI